MKIRCRSIIALLGRRRVLSADGEVSLLLADAHTAISHLLNDMSFCGVMNTHKSQRSLRKLPDNAQIKILAGKNPARTTDILKGGDMIDKMLEKLEVFDNDPHEEVCTSQMKKLLLSAKPEWEAMVKRVEALEKRMDAEHIIAKNNPVIAENPKFQYCNKYCDVCHTHYPESFNHKCKPVTEENTCCCYGSGTCSYCRDKKGDKPSECEPEYTWQEVIQDHKKYREALKDNISIPRDVAVFWVKTMQKRMSPCDMDRHDQELFDAIKQQLG